MAQIIAAKDQLIIRAKQAPDVSTTFSRSYPIDPAKVAWVTKLLRSETHPDVRDGNIANPAYVTQFLVVTGDKVYPFTQPFVATNAANIPMFVGSLSDTIGTLAPTTIPGVRLRGWFTTLVPLAAAQEYDLKFIDGAPPDTIEGPPTAAGLNDGAAPSLARLNYGADADTEEPRIAALPVALPIPVGVPIPATPWSVHDENPELFAVFPFAEVWRKGMSYHIQQNDGWAVTAPRVMGEGLFDDQALAPHMARFANITLVDSGRVPFTMLSPAEELYIPMERAIKEASDSAWVRIGLTLPPVEPPAPPPVAPVAGIQEAALERIVDAFTRNSRSSTEKEHAASAAETIRKFQLAFARLEPSPDNTLPPTVVLAQLSPQAVAIITATKLETARKLFHELIETAVRAASRSTDRWDSDVTLKADMIDAVFVQSIRDYKFLQQGLNTHPAAVKTHLSVLAFATPAIDSMAYKSRQERDDKLQCQAAVGEAPTKMDRKTTELYVGGEVKTGKDAMAMICNKRLVYKSLCPDFLLSEYWKAMVAYEIILHGPNGKLFINLLANLPQLGLHLMADIQDVMAAYHNIGNASELRNAVEQGDPIHPSPYQAANRLSSDISNTLFSTVARNFTLAYKEVPRIVSVLPHLGIQMPVDGFNFVAAKAKPLAGAPQLSGEGRFPHPDGQKTHRGRENQRANNSHVHPHLAPILARRIRRKAFWFGQGRVRCHHIAKSEFKCRA